MAAPESVQSESAESVPTTIESLNPATGEVLGSVPIHSAEEVQAKVARARAAAAEWRQLTFAERQSELDAYRRALAARADEFADLIYRENGKPRLDALIEVTMALEHLAYAARNAERVLAPRRVKPGILANFRAHVKYHPMGVIGVIGPWNYPIYTPIGSIGYAMAAGNGVVFKPSELTPLVGQMLAEVAATSMALPDLLQVVTGAGSTGAALCASGVDKIAFTGSAATGRRVMAAAAQTLTPVLMELGGKDAMVVAADADVERAAHSAVFGSLTNAGQTCISIERVYVDASIYDRFIERVVDVARNIRVGGDGESDLGAMTRPEQVAQVRAQVRDAVAKGARVLVGGPDAVDGNFLSPTVLVDVTDDMLLMQEETFGPVLPIIRVTDAAEGIARANASPFGLGSAVFGRHGVRGMADAMRAGMTTINSVLAYSAVPTLPFGGVGESGFGRIHGDEGLREFSRVQSVLEERMPLPKALDVMRFPPPPGTYGRLRALIAQMYGGGAVDRAGSLLGRLRLRRRS